MPQTYNISLPKPLAQQLDLKVKQEGYSSRSELFRTALRLYLKLSQGQTSFDLAVFHPQPLDEIKKELELTGNHTPEFINSVISGLAKSSLYEKSAPPPGS